MIMMIINVWQFHIDLWRPSYTDCDQGRSQCQHEIFNIMKHFSGTVVQHQNKSDERLGSISSTYKTAMRCQHNTDVALKYFTIIDHEEYFVMKYDLMDDNLFIIPPLIVFVDHDPDILVLNNCRM